MLLSHASDSHSNTSYSHNARSFANDIVWNANNFGVTDERSEMLAWLSPLEPRIRHHDIRTHRADNVGEWLLRTEEFRRWSDAQQEKSEHAVLFCCGDPGAGKTYFSSLVVDRLCDKAKKQDVAVACFYVDFAAQEEQSPANMLGSLLKQIVGVLGRMPDEISRAFQDHKKAIGGRAPRAPEIVKMLQTVTSLRRTFICIDGLDQSAEGVRPEVLDSLGQVLEKSPNARIFLTGRRHIRGDIERHLSGRPGILSIKQNNSDLVGYIRMRLSKGALEDVIDSGLEAEIVKTIAENIPETFLLFSLTMDTVLGETTAYGSRQKLRAITDGKNLEDFYAATLQRIEEQRGEKARLGMAALMWISHSERRLQLDELLHALAVEMGSTDLNEEVIPSVEALLSSCLGLLVLDREASTVRLVHYTLQEYLCDNCLEVFGAAHSIMAETCLTYLNFQSIMAISPTLFTLPRSTPFLRYSSLYWGVHAKRGASRDVVSLALKLLSQIERHISAKLLLADIVSRAGRSTRDIPINGHLIGFTGLHCASIFGIVEVATSLIGRLNHDLNRRDFLGITPLIWAAICGQEEVAKLLLGRKTVIPNKPDKCFLRTALSWAARSGHQGVVRALLSRPSAKLCGTDGLCGKTSRVIDMILGRRSIDPNRPDRYGQTPISLAAEAGHEGATKLLLGRKGVKPDTVDRYSRTPLSWASRGGHGGVVKLLLEREDVNPNTLERDGDTLLLLASRVGRDAVVKVLLERGDVNPNLPNKYGLTPLFRAIWRGHEGVVKLLLEREDVNPNMIDQDGDTPLLLASMLGREGVVKLLLEREDVNPNMPNKYGVTPLLRASWRGHEGVIKLLLEREDTNPDRLGNGENPLS